MDPKILSTPEDEGEAMIAGAPFGLILFVAGEPDPGIPSVRDSTVHLTDRLIGVYPPLGRRMKPSPGTSIAADDAQPLPSGEPPWRLPPEQIHCVNTVFEMANLEGATLTVIDVDRAGERQYLVDRWFAENQLIPLLVRADGSKLDGIENFTPRKVRQFIRGA